MAASATRERRPDREPRAETERAPPTSSRRRSDRSPDVVAGPSGHDVGRCPVRPAVRPLRATGVSAPGDAAETHAEAVAHRVRHGAVPDATHTAGSLARLPRSASAAFSVGLPPIVDRVLASPTGGTPMPAAVRGRVEPHVGVDLGGVRVLTGPRASAAAASIGARAFTAGPTIVLGRGQSAHDTGLMAHESAHVAQHALAPAGVDVHRATILRDLLPSLPDLPDISVTDLLPQSLLDAVAGAVRSLPGYTLLTQVIGIDPLTDAPVEADPQAMLDELLSYGPFGAAVGQALQAMDALDAVVAVVRESLGRYGLTSERLSADIDTAWAQFSITNGVDGNLAIVARVVGGILADVGRFVGDLAARVLAIVREAVVDLAESLLTGGGALGPVWQLATKVFHHDPLRGVPVEAATVDILADFLHLIGQDAALDQMRERGTLQETADWLDAQFATFLGLLDQATTLFGDAWAAIQPENLAQLPETLPGLIQQEFALVAGVGTFAGTVLLKVIELVKHSLVSWLSEYAYAIPGFRLVSVIIGQNPFTGEEVPLTAENLIGGFITLLPGGEATYQQLAETGVIGEAAARIESAMATLGITPELITSTFLGLWNTLSLEDLLAPLDAFQRVVALFGEPIARIVQFVAVVVQVVIELVLRLMNFPSDLLAHILSQTVQAITDIQADPVGFLLRMVEALKAGFQGFLDNSLDYLMQGLVAWLFRGLAQLGITIPTEISFGSILGLVLEVLGLTTDFIWRKLEEHTSKDQVEAIRKGMATLGGAWAFVQDVSDRGIVAIWEYVVDQLSTLWSTILSMAAEWALKTIIVNGTIKLLTFLDPTFIMSVVNGCIAFFEAVRSAIEYITDILQIVDMYVSTFASIAKGDIGPGAQMIEQGLAAAVPVALGFLAAQLGLGNIPDKIAEIIGSIREVVEAAIDWLIEQAMKLGAAALSSLDSGDGHRGSVLERKQEISFAMSSENHTLTMYEEPNMVRVWLASGSPREVIRVQNGQVRADRMSGDIEQAMKEAAILTLPPDVGVLLNEMQASVASFLGESMNFTMLEDPLVSAQMFVILNEAHLILHELGEKYGFISLTEYSHPSRFVTNGKIDGEQVRVVPPQFYRYYTGNADATWRANALADKMKLARGPYWRTQPPRNRLSGTYWLCPGKPHIANHDDKHFGDLQLDHIDTVADHWNDIGRKGIQDEREKFYNLQTNWQPLCAHCNNSKPKEIYTLEVGQGFRGPGE